MPIASLNGPAWQASVGDMVPRDDLPAAVALNSMGFIVARSKGPAVGGLIVATFGAAAAFAVSAVSYLGLLVVLARWHSPKRPERLQRETLARAISAGLRYVALSPAIITMLARDLVFGLGLPFPACQRPAFECRLATLAVRQADDCKGARSVFRFCLPRSINGH